MGERMLEMGYKQVFDAEVIVGLDFITDSAVLIRIAFY